MESTVTSMGQTTLPKPVRDFLGLKPGDKVKFFIQPDGRVVLLPTLPVTALNGIVRSTRRVSRTRPIHPGALLATGNW